MRSFKKLQELSRNALLSNAVLINKQRYFRAGAHQFGSLWTRDFCFATQGILAVGSANLSIAPHLSLLLRSINDESLVPRIFDSIWSGRRVLSHTVFPWLPRPELTELKPEFLGEHRTRAIDSNILTLWSVFHLLTKTGDAQWLKEHRYHINKCWNFYQDKWSNGLLIQGRFEDWQDSAAREGATSYLNLLYYGFCRGAAPSLEIPVSNSQVEQHAKEIYQKLFDPKLNLFKTSASSSTYGLDANLFALEYYWHNPAHFASLRASPLWQQYFIPGCPTWPKYPRKEISWTTKIIGLGGYHDSLVWPWLSAQAAKIAYLYGDVSEAERILSELQILALQDLTIAEVIDPKTRRPLKTWLYKAESPFTWSAGKILEALSVIAPG